MKVLRQLWFLLTRSRREADLRAEMQLHVELRAAANARRGLPPTDAARTARVRFGNALKWREESRDAWGFMMLEQTLKDLIYAARQLARRPTWTATVVLTLALGVGATSAVFTLIDALLFRPGVGDQPDRLVWIASVSHPGGDISNVSYPDYVAFRDRAKTVAGVMAFSGADVGIGGRSATRIYGDVASGNYFDVLRVPASLGRTLAPDDDRPGALPVVVIGDALWRLQFDADPSVIGQRVPINGSAFTIVGVTPPGFVGAELGKDVELWVPLAFQAIGLPGNPKDLASRADARWLRVMARLADDASIARANAELDVIAAAIAPADEKPEKRKTTLVASTTGGLHPANRKGLAVVLALIGVLPVLILLVACANVANVVMAQNISRQREFAMRRAIGAPRARLLRQLLVETALLAVLSAIAGLMVSGILTAVVTQLGELPVEFGLVMQTNARVVLTTIAIALATIGLFGLAPALAATRFDLVGALKEQSAAVTSGGRHARLRSAFLVTQVAVSLALVIATGLFLRSLTKALEVDPGFVARGAVSVTVDPRLQGYTPDRVAQFGRAAVERASMLPGVTSVGTTSFLPLAGATRGRRVTSEDGERKEQALDSSVTGDYFKAMGIPLVAGRTFSASDVEGAPRVTIVNETLARQMWPGENAIGHRLVDLCCNTSPQLEVIGVAKDGKYSSLDEEPRPASYEPASQRAAASGAPLTVVARTTGDETAVLRELAGITKTLDPNMPAYRTEPLTETLRATAQTRRGAAALVGVSGVIALVVAAIGIYGVAAHNVSARTREVGIRMALGARVSDVLRLFVSQNLKLAAIGVAIGLVLSVAAARVLTTFLFGLAPTDLVTFLGGAVVLTLVAAVASYLPARQAARVHPGTTLRQ